MRILILSPSVYPEPGGLQRYTYYLAQSLARRGSEILVFTLAEVDVPENEQANVSFVSLDRLSSVGSGLLGKVLQKLYLLWFLVVLMMRFRPEKMICTWWDPLGYVTMTLSFIFGVPYICIGHGQEVAGFPGRALTYVAKERLRKWIFQNAVAVVAVSRFTKERIISIGVSEHKIRVIPNGLSTSYIEESSRFTLDKARERLGFTGAVILQVGRIVPRKGHEFILALLPYLIQELHFSVYYVVVGSGPYKCQLEQKVQELDLVDNVIFAGYVPDEQLHLYYSAADILVMPSYNPNNLSDAEGFGIVYLEAYAHERPVIGVSAGGATDAIVDGETGILVPPMDGEALKLAIIKLLKDKEISSAMGRRGRALLESMWNWDVLSEEFVRL